MISTPASTRMPPPAPPVPLTAAGQALLAARRIAGAGTSAAAWRADPALAQVAPVPLHTLLPAGARAVLVAPHPDDEVLAWGGLLLQLGALQAPGTPPPLLVAVTDGEASHPGSRLWPRERLRRQRPLETTRALAALGYGGAARAIDLVRLGLADGAVMPACATLAAALAALLDPGDVLFTTWRYDGHPDHEACAAACAQAARAGGHVLFETPVWGWHWNSPSANAMPLAQARRLPLTAAQLAHKRAALDCFASQRSADPASGAAPILADSTIARALLDFELFFPCPP